MKIGLHLPSCSSMPSILLIFSLISRASGRFLLLITPLFFTGCFAFYLPDRPVPAEISSTAARLAPSLQFSMTAPTQSDLHTGNQYLLFFPFRRIYLENPAEFFSRKAHVAAALEGKRIEYSERNPDLELIVEEVSLSAFDLFVTRKIVASITVRASIDDQLSPHALTFSESDSDFVRYAFSDSLHSLLERVTLKALRKAIIWYGDIRKPSLR